MKARLKTQITIDADPTVVYKYLSHTKYHQLWNPHMQSISRLIQLKQGSVYTAQSLVLGILTESENHVTSYIQDQQLEIQNETGMVQYSINFRLQPREVATRVICMISVSSQSKAFAFAKPLLESLARRELRADLVALKEAVEQKLR